MPKLSYREEKTMKKLLALVLTLMLMLAFVIGLASCNKVEFKINFVVDGESYAEVTTDGSESITMPENPTKDGYTFDGWYLDDGVWTQKFTENSPINANINVYAKFEAVVTPPSNDTPSTDSPEVNNPSTDTPTPDAHTHTLVHNPAVSAICTTDGTKEYWHCSTCNKN